ncbi:MAG: toxin-antitoxin (TA) system antitoxin [Desulfamplus sp.]|nr:toxin-antitoxin (TA) system antitoxin [Desulfamplus sp.]
MLTKMINIKDIQTNINDLLLIALEGTEIIFTENNIPLARLTPMANSISRQAGLHKGVIWTSEDFDEPLPESFWTEHS